MNKLYDKILLVVAVLALVGGCAVYFMGSTPDVRVGKGPGDNAYIPVVAQSTDAVSVDWGEPVAQPSGFIYDVFTPYEIYLDKDGNFTQQGPNITITGNSFGNPYLVKIERELFRIQLEGYIEEDPSDPSKVLLLFLNNETGMSVRGRVGQEKPNSEFTVVDFAIVREEEDGGIVKTARATIRDTRTGSELTLTDDERRYSDEITVVIGSSDDSSLMLEFTEAGSSFETTTGNYVIEQINLEESSVTVKKLGDDVNEPIIKVLTAESPNITDNTTPTEPAPITSPADGVFDVMFQ